MPKFSIIIPVYNEAQAIQVVLEELKNYLEKKEHQAEIIVVNDGSTDQTQTVLQNIPDIQLINHPYNKGYGASLKTGAQKAQSDWLLWYDSDGQHQPHSIENLMTYRNKYDMVVGARIGYKGPFFRQPGKKLLGWLANYLTGRKIPDLNSGLRLVKKDPFLKFSHIFPNGFSISTTITLAFLKEGLNVKYAPIKIAKRTGQSSVKLKDGFKTALLILRTIVLFSPLRIFMPISFLLFALSLASLTLDIFLFSQGGINIADTTVLLFISSLIIFFFGLLTDQVSALRREWK